MNNHRDDFLVEILTEELPPKSLLKLSEAFTQQIKERIEKANFVFSKIQTYATPRRLAVLVQALSETQPTQTIERRGPAKAAAFDAAGNPSQACIGFARSLGVTPNELITLKNEQGEWVGFTQTVPGKSVKELLPQIVEQALASLPIPKRMRWGDNDTQFVRPVHSVILLYGDQMIDAEILGCHTKRVTQGHRFLSPNWVTIPHAAAYESLLETEGYVIADFAKRKEMIKHGAIDRVKKDIHDPARVFISSDALLNEVTGLVEWPVAMCGHFDESFLSLPKEVLISAMQDHQRYFPVIDEEEKLLPHFVAISNIQSADPARVIHGNERVLRARLSDAAFFFETDKKESLDSRIERLKGIVFQAKLGTLYDKAERISKLAATIAEKLNADVNHAKRAGMLAKTDLTTLMVGEFPELQGVMGSYYASHDHEPIEIVAAMKEQYLPRYAGDKLSETRVGQALAIADRIDTLVGTFGINQIPTGDKDPYGLRRACVGILRTLIEKEIDVDVKELLEMAYRHYSNVALQPDTVSQVWSFMLERLRAIYQEQNVSADVFAAVAAIGVTNPFDLHKRIKAVQSFKKLTEAESLSIANKRVSNILSKYAETLEAKTINPTYFENVAEKELAKQLEAKNKMITGLSETDNYDEILFQLAELRQPIDDFFDQVMVMTDDKPRRENRILLLTQLRALFLQVADIALLQ